MNKLIIFAALFLSSCGTMLSGTEQDINIKIVDQNNNLLEGTACLVTDARNGTHILHSNPGIIKVARANKGILTIDCKKPGYKQLNMHVGDSFNSATIVNILFWPGFIIDAAAGSYNKYPSHYLVRMDKINN